MPIYLYTAKTDDVLLLLELLDLLDGICVTLHDAADVFDFRWFALMLCGRFENPKTARALERMGVPYSICVEPAEHDKYKR